MHNIFLRGDRVNRKIWPTVGRYKPATLAADRVSDSQNQQSPTFALHVYSHGVHQISDVYYTFWKNILTDLDGRKRLAGQKSKLFIYCWKCELANVHHHSFDCRSHKLSVVSRYAKLNELTSTQKQVHAQAGTPVRTRITSQNDCCPHRRGLSISLPGVFGYFIALWWASWCGFKIEMAP